MKILMLGWELPPFNSGGLGVACHEIAKNLAVDGVELDFVLPYHADHGISEYTIHGSDTYSVHQVQTSIGAYDSHKVTSTTTDTRSLESVNIREIQKHYTAYVEQLVLHDVVPDIIHAHDWLTFEAAMRAKELTGKPLIAHVHATEFDRSGEHAGNQLVHEIEYNGLMMADRIIAVSQITKDVIHDNYGIPLDKIEVVHNAINIEDFIAHDETSADTYAYVNEMKQMGYSVVVSLGRLTVQKGLTHFLRAAAKASYINERMIFIIAGSGEQRDELIELAADLGISHKVIFTGFIRGRQWRDAYNIGDMFVMSSVSEPFGLTALEAAGSGNAIILSKQSGVGEVLHNALRYDYWDIDKLANQMLNVSLYPELKTSMQDNVRHEFMHFTWSDVSKKLTNLYDTHMSTARVAA